MRADSPSLAIRPPTARAAFAQRRTPLDELFRRSVLGLLSKMARGRITLVDGDERFSFGEEGGAPSATIVVLSPAAYGAVMLGGNVGAGEAYMRGHWACDDLPALARIFSRNVDVLRVMDARLVRLARRVSGLFGAGRGNTRAASRQNIAHHYDLGNELFSLFLDESMTYSSAIYDRPDASLGEAQTAKLERVCDKLDLGPRDHLLEVGTGWGALAVFAARTRGCRVTTTTVSREQHDAARERVQVAGLDERIEVLLRDYRDLEGQYDKVVSIEMIEAVGHDYMDGFFRACSDRMIPSGVMLIQAITIADQHHERHKASVDFIKKYIFPGSCIPSVTSMITSATRATDLRLSDLEELTPHYARTLRAWRERFLAETDRVRRLGFDDAFVRMWEYYLASCEGAFEERYLGCVQMVFTKPDCRRGEAQLRLR